MEPFGEDTYTPYADARFRTVKKHKVREVDAPTPALEAPLADTHVHFSMLRNPALALARCAIHGVGFVCCITNPHDDADTVYSQINGWFEQAAGLVGVLASPNPPDLYDSHGSRDAALGSPNTTHTSREEYSLPAFRIACGCHPHDAQYYDDAMEEKLVAHLKDPRTCCVGEIGLDFHYDYSPRDDQRRVFRRQVQLAHAAGLPIALHLREAHDEALAIMDEEGFPEAGTILHCFNLGPDVLAPWVERGCYIAVGGAATFGSSDGLRAALPHIPRNRFLFETDGPFMAPTPFRGCECTSDLTVFTAAYIADVLGLEAGQARQEFLEAVYANSLRFLNREPTPWQLG